MRTPRIRPPHRAGQFYPADPVQLRTEVTEMLRRATIVETPGAPAGLLAPHAGYVYSGPTAARAYRQLEGRAIQRAVVFGPSHYAAFPGAAVYDGDGFETPLGVIPLDAEMIRALLAKSPPFIADAGAHEPEHSIEVQLPFLQAALGEFRLVPILLHDQSEANVRAVAAAALEALRESADIPTVIVASSDLYHGYDREECLRQDDQFAALLERFDGAGMVRAMRGGQCMACGMGALAATMLMARERGAARAQALGRANSQDVRPGGSGEYIVGYAAAMFV